MSFVPITFLDTSRATAGFVSRYRSQQKVGNLWMLDHIPLRAGGKDEEILAEWKSMRSLLSLIRSAGAHLMDGVPAHIETALVFSLNPGKRFGWFDPSASECAWVWCCLIPNPQAVVISGSNAMSLMTGMLTAVDRKSPMSMINTGHSAASYLVMDVRRPGPN